MVHIKKVEIFGFKSFGFKNTIVDFEPGLISISGPNGSGKSNILDAIIFALGENRPKVMRAPNLRALIHDIEGSTRRGPKMARSSVQFDNTDRKIPVGKLCEQCGEGKIHQKIGVPLFAYDNISSPGHKKSTPSWMKDKLKDIKRNQPGATMTVPE